jgi:hypothetical protein
MSSVVVRSSVVVMSSVVVTSYVETSIIVVESLRHHIAMLLVRRPAISIFFFEVSIHTILLPF